MFKLTKMCGFFMSLDEFGLKKAKFCTPKKWLSLKKP